MVKGPKFQSPNTSESLKNVKSPKVKKPKTPKGKTTKSASKKSPVEITPMKSPKSEKKKKSLLETPVQIETSITESPKKLAGEKIKKENEAGKIPEHTDAVPPTGLANKFEGRLASIEEKAKKGLSEFLELSEKKKSIPSFQDLPVTFNLIVNFSRPPPYSKTTEINIPHVLFPRDVVVVTRGIHTNVDDELKSPSFKEKMLLEHNIKLWKVYTLAEFENKLLTHESKIAFSKRGCVVLVERPILLNVFKIMGNEPHPRRTNVIGFFLNNIDLPGSLRTPLKKTVLKVTKGISFTYVKVGNDKLTADELLENLLEVYQRLENFPPGVCPSIEQLALEAFGLTFHLYSAMAKIIPSVDKTTSKQIKRLQKLAFKLNKPVTLYPDGHFEYGKTTVCDDTNIGIPENEEVADSDDDTSNDDVVNMGIRTGEEVADNDDDASDDDEEMDSD